METLFILNSVKHKDDVKGPSKVYDQVKSNIRNWNLLNANQKSCGTFLLYLLSEKLPSEICLIITRKFGEEAMKIKIYATNIIKVELFAKEHCVTLSSENNNKLLQLAVLTIKIKHFHLFFVN